MIRIKISFEDPEELEPVMNRLQDLPIVRQKAAKGSRFYNMYLDLDIEKVSGQIGHPKKGFWRIPD